MRTALLRLLYGIESPASTALPDAMMVTLVRHAFHLIEVVTGEEHCAAIFHAVFDQRLKITEPLRGI
jgi:hypothetical protein